MESTQLIKTLRINDKKFENQLEQFLKDKNKHGLIIKLDKNSHVKSIVRIDNIDDYLSSLEDSIDVLIIKSNGHHQPPEVIRWVTDNEAVQHIRKLFNNFQDENKKNDKLNANHVLELYDQINRFTDRPTVLQFLTDERSKLMEAILEWSDNLLELENDHYAQNGEMNSKTFDRIAEKIIRLKKRENKLLEILLSGTELFSDLLKHQNYRMNLQETVQMLQNESKQLFILWEKESNSEIEVEVLNRSCIEFISESPHVTLTKTVISIIESSEKLSKYGLKVDPGSSISELQKVIVPLLEHVKTLQDIVDFYNRIGSEIRPCHASLLLRHAKHFTELLESIQTKSVKWNFGPEKINTWIDLLQNSMKSLVEQNNSILEEHNKMIEILIKSFDDIDMSPSVKHWIDNKLPVSLSKIKTYNEEIKLMFDNTRQTLTWRKHIDYQIYKVIRYALLNASNRISSGISNYIDFNNDSSNQNNQTIVNLQLNSQGNIVYEPSIEHIKHKYIQTLNSLIQLPSTVTGLVDWKYETELKNNRTMFYAFYLSNDSKEQIKKFYLRLNKLVSELIEMKKPFQIWSCLYLLIQRIKSDLYEGKYDDLNQTRTFDIQALEEYRSVLEQIRSMNQQFNISYDIINEYKSNIWPELTINIVPIKMLIRWLVGEARVVILQILMRQITIQSNRIEKLCSENLEKFQNKPETLDELINFEQFLVNYLPKIHADLRVDVVNLKEKIKFAESYQQTFINEQRINALLHEFEEYFVRSQDIRAEIMERLIEVIKNERIKIENDVDDFLDRWSRLGDLLKSAPEIVSNFVTNSQELKSQIEPLKNAKKHLNPKDDSPLFKNYHQFEVVCDEITKLNGKYGVLREYEQALTPFLESEWIVSRNKLSFIEEQLNEWSTKHVKSNESEVVTTYLNSWHDFIASLQICKGENYSPNHWSIFLSILELDNSLPESIKTNDLYRKRDNLISSQEQIKELNKMAVRDQYIDDTFRELESIDQNTRFQVANYATKDGKSIQIIKNWQESLDVLSDASLLVASLRELSEDSNQQTQNRIQEWEDRLSLCQLLITNLSRVQRKWISLEPIFSPTTSGNASESFTTEREMFTRNSIDFQRLLRQIILENRSRILGLTFIDSKLENRLENYEKNFGIIQKRLRNMMESARQRFPRFYFLSDDDLLLILSGKVDLNESGLIQKLFSNTISKLIYDKTTKVIAIQSIQGEMIKLHKEVNLPKECSSTVIESGLIELSNEIEASLVNEYRKYYDHIEKIYSADIWSKISSQICSLFCWIDFTNKIEYSLPKNSLISLQSEYEKYLKYFTNHDDKTEIISKFNQNNPNYPETLLEIRIRQTVLDLIHYLQVIERLLLNSVTNVDDWQWQQELRFYTSSSNLGVLVRMGVSTIDYSFSHYLGAIGDSKLVHTELTNRCFLTMTQAAALGLGANPYGPAGTGKTETVKALGAHLGREVLVFNCDEAIDTRAIIRILLGIVQCGAWACFDEFNRLQLDVLSVLSTLIGTLQDALKSGKSKITLPPGLSEVSSININHNSAIFITLNPAGKYYGARNELPDNLKALFLPVSMTIPDLKEIISFLLVAQGFTRSIASTIAIKICILFDFASESLSSQRHYDWGLRAMKACISSASKYFTSNMSNDEQFEIIVQSLKQQIRPKLVDDDIEQFDLLLDSVFGQELQRITSKNELKNDEIADAFKELNLVQDSRIIQKIHELYSQLQSRLGVVLVGPTGTGKTTVWKVLKKVLENKCENNEKIKICLISPKSIVPKSHLFGVINSETRDWIDGLFTMNARLSTTNTDRIWFIFDGEIDPEWVEALNSVLDDNRVLTLASGERINFDPERCNILFECSSLLNASPATISRLGVICFPINSSILEYVFNNTNSEILKDILHKNNINSKNIQKFLSIVRTMRICEKDFNLEVLFDDIYSSEHDKNISSNDGYYETILGNGIVQTSNITTIKERIERIVQEKENFIGLLIFGPNCCGKCSLLDGIIFKDITATVIRYNCSSKSDSKSLIKLLLKSGSLKRTKNGNQCLHFNTDICWLVIRKWELLLRDKWNDNSLEAFVLFLLSFHGFYHYETLEWIEVERLNIVLTSNNRENVNVRLQSRLHHFHMSPLTLNDIIKIISSKAQICQRDDLSSILPTKLADFSDNFMVENHGSFNHLLISFNILTNLLKTQNNDDKLLDQEIKSVYRSYLSDKNDLEKFKESFTIDDEAYYFPEVEDNKFEVKIMNKTEIKNEIVKTFKKFEQTNIFMTKSIIELYEKLTFFLSSDVNNSAVLEEYNVQTMFLIGNRGFYREKMTHLLGECFGYQIWTCKNILNERQLINDFKQIFSSENAEKNDKKVLLFVDQIYLECLPFLEHYILELSRPNKITNNSKTTFHTNSIADLSTICLRIVISKDQIQQNDISTWLRDNVYQTIISRPERDDYEMISKNILKEFDRSFTDKLFDIFMHFTDKRKNNTSYRNDAQTNMLMFIAYVEAFIKQYEEYRSKMINECERLKSGVSALDRVSEAVRILKNETLEKRKLLDIKQKDADEAFEMIVASMQSSEDKREELEKLQNKFANETEELRKQKQNVDEELAQIEPLLEKAKESVGSIKNEALSEVRSLRAPPTVIRDILEGVLRLLGVKDTSWNSMKNYLSRKGISQIINFDPSQVSKQTLDQVDQLLEARGSSFEPMNAKRASIAAASLAEWVTANVRYGQVMSKVRPYQLELERLESKLNNAQIRLKTLGLEMQGVDTQVQLLRERMQKLTVEAAQIEMNLKESNNILESSELLVSQLSSEHKRWREKLSKIQLELSRLEMKLAITVGYCLLTTNHTQQSIRKQLLEDAIGRFLPEIDYLKLKDMFEMSEIECYFKFQDDRTVFLVFDPHNKVIQIIKQKYDKIILESKESHRQIELAQRLGRTIIIDNVESKHLNDSRIIELFFGTRIQKHSDYRAIVMVNNFASFEQYPSVLSLTRQINLGGSFETIIETLQARMLQIKAPELQNEIEQIQNILAEQNKQLNILENDLLSSLSDQYEDGQSIVKDKNLITKLAKLKESSTNIEDAIKRSTNILDNNLKISVDKYRHTVEIASQMYKIIECLTIYSSIYHISFTEYENIFKNILQQNMSNNQMDDSVLVQAIYDYVSRSLFPSHQRALSKLINKQFNEIFPSLSKHNFEAFLKDNLIQNKIKTILIITGKGENVMSDINRIVGNSMIYISLGVPSIGNAETLFRTSLKQTKVVCLANLHLVSNWLTTLAHLLTLDRQFTVILISEMCEHLPKILLEQCIKYVHHSGSDSTTGSKVPVIKNNEITDKIELIHWIITERRLYVPIGWSKMYEFGNAEKIFSQYLLELIYRKSSSTNKKTVNISQWLIGLLRNVIYGAKLDAKHDRLILENILQRCLNRTNYQQASNYLTELQLPENVSRIRSRTIQDELSKNYNIILKVFYEKIDSQNMTQNDNTNKDKKKANFGYEYFHSLWEKILKKCQIFILDNNSLEFSSINRAGSDNKTSILKQEIIKCKELFKHIHEHLFCKKSDKTSEIEEINKYLKINETPSDWRDVWPIGSNVAQQYLIDIAIIYRKLMDSDMNDSRIDLKGCLDPCSVFRKIQQNASNRLGLCLDELEYDCFWNDQQQHTGDGLRIYVSGIAVEGAIYDEDNNRLTTVITESEVINSMPELCLHFKKSSKKDNQQSIVYLPLFINSTRETLITDKISVPCQTNMKNRFIEMGAAFILLDKFDKKG